MRRSWAKLSMHGTTVLGIAMILLVWGTIALHLRMIERTTIQGALQDTANLARAFEEQTARTIRGIDSTLLVLRAIYVKNPETFDLPEWTWHAGILTDVVLQYAILDRDGKLWASSIGGRVPPLDLSDRDHFKVHIDSAVDELFISKPLIGRNSGKQTIMLSRRILMPDGTFAGVIVATVDPAKFVEFYQSIDIGRDGAINLIGLDSVVRASKGFKRPTTTLNTEGGAVARAPAQAVGSFTSAGQVDGVRRIISYRKVSGLPLVVAVGLGESETLESFYDDAFKYVAGGIAITILVLVVMLLSGRNRKALTKAYYALRRSEMVAQAHKVELRTALENIEQGLLMVDADNTITVINRRAAELLDLPEEWLAPGRKMKDMIEYLTDRGEFPNNEANPKLHAMLASDGQNANLAYERTRPNGITLEVRSMPTPDGGLVRTLTDVTERKKAEARIAQMATHDALTGLANRSLFRERVDQALARAQRYELPFALLMLDLDRFKPINDTLGHPVGDKVLKLIARRLQDCVRDSDTVARLGGDEFVILQANAESEEDARRLAQRILDAVALPLDVDGKRIEIGTTVGIAMAPRDGTEHDELIGKADKALYEGKKSGRHCYGFAGESPPLQPSQTETAPSLPASPVRRPA